MFTTFFTGSPNIFESVAVSFKLTKSKQAEQLY